MEELLEHFAKNKYDFAASSLLWAWGRANKHGFLDSGREFTMDASHVAQHLINIRNEHGSENKYVNRAFKMIQNAPSSILEPVKKRYSEVMKAVNTLDQNSQITFNGPK